MLYGALTREHAIPVAYVGRGNGIDIVDEFLANLWANESSIIVFRSGLSHQRQQSVILVARQATRAMPCHRLGVCKMVSVRNC